jgi:hypothetical protein
MKRKIVGAITLAALSLASGVLAQEDMLKVKGGHELGESAGQFFSEGYEKQALSACATGDFKGVSKANKRQLKQYCDELADARRQATSAQRYDYKGGGDLSEMRTDTFTFDSGHLVKVELLFSAPSAEVNYRGQSFQQIFTGIKQAYGPPTSESTRPVRNAYGVEFLAHRELWLASQAAILIKEQPGEGGSTTLVAFTRAEYDRTMAADVPKAPNPLQ